MSVHPTAKLGEAQSSPADHNWVRNVAVAELLVRALEELDPQYPPPDPSLADVRIS
jgi:hypothetical protein